MLYGDKSEYIFVCNTLYDFFVFDSYISSGVHEILVRVDSLGVKFQYIPYPIIKLFFCN